MTYTYNWPMSSNTVDIVVFGLDFTDRVPKILLIRRGKEHEPFYNCWALPGGFLDVLKDPDLLAAAFRELREETGSEPKYVEQLATFSDKDRDPRGRTISTAFMALVRPETLTVKAADDAADAQWFPVDKLPKLAFDHDKIIEAGLERLKSKVRWQPVGFELLPDLFTLSDLQRVYEAILGTPLDKRGFRRKVMKFGVLVDTRKTEPSGPGSGRRGPAGRLYRFDKRRYEKLLKSGLAFEV